LVTWYIFSRFGLLCQEKSGNPDPAAPENTAGLKNEKGWRLMFHPILSNSRTTLILDRTWTFPTLPLFLLIMGKLNRKWFEIFPFGDCTFWPRTYLSSWARILN
jgi:hypothetical protein